MRKPIKVIGFPDPVGEIPFVISPRVFRRKGGSKKGGSMKKMR